MKSLFLLFLLIAGTSLAQDSTNVTTFSSTLSLGDALQFGGRSIKFQQLISDSRCPDNPSIACIWAGEAKLLVEVFEQGRSCGTEILTVTSGEQAPHFLQKVFPGEKVAISALELTPYPKVPGEIIPEDYRLNLEVKFLKKEE